MDIATTTSFYLMSGKDTFQYKRHQRQSVSNIALLAVPPRTSSLPVLGSSSSNHKTTKKSSEGNSKEIMRGKIPADLRLDGRQSGYDFSSWIESTIDELQARPVYADPSSAIVPRPYRDGLGETSFHRLSKSADWESVKVPAPLFSKPRSEQSPKCSGSTLAAGSDKQSNAGSRDAFGMQRTTSSGLNKSDHSIKSQEERASEAPWMKPLPSVPVIGSIISPTVVGPIQSDSCPSMPCTPGLLLDAITAGHSFKTSFKIPSGVGVTSAHSAAHSRNVSDASFVSAVSSLDFPILEPSMMHDLARTASPVRSMDTPLEPHAMGKRRKLYPSTTAPTWVSFAPPPATIPVSSTADLMSPLCGLSNYSFAKHGSNEGIGERQWKLSSIAISGILADISSSIAEFPTKMICLDTPCVVAIRHNMYAERTTKTASSSAASFSITPISLPSAYARRNEEPKIKKSASVLRKGSVRGRTSGHIGNMLAMPLPASLRAGSPAPASLSPPPTLTHSTSNESAITLLRPDPYSPTMDLLSYYRNDLDTHFANTNIQEVPEGQGLRCPDLSVIASIFPGSDGWWQSCLLAHLLAYNYLHTLNSALPSSAGARTHSYGPGRAVPDKAARTMGVSDTAVIGKEETRYSKVLQDLEKCMVRIMKSMMGKREGVLGLSSSGEVLGKGELALVMALSVVVRGMDV